MWICDSASMHVTWSNKGAKNIQDMMMYSLGHAGLEMESNALINIPGVFVNKSRKTGLQVVLKDCSFIAKHNFNLLSMSRLLHKQAWKIVHVNETLIHIENRKGDVIDFDIVVPTEKGAIHACNFAHIMEVGTASTENVARLNISKDHCLFGHQNEDSVWKTARELRWVLRRGTLMPNEHSARSNAKQKNV